MNPEAMTMSSEANAFSEKYQEEEQIMRDKLQGVLFSENFEKRHKSLISFVENMSKYEFIQQEIDQYTFDEMKERLEALLESDDEEIYIDEVVSIMQPLLKLKVEKPVLYEDVQALAQMEVSGFTPLNSRVSYGLTTGREGNRYAHIHFAPSHELKKTYDSKGEWVDAMQELYEDGLRQVAQIAHDDESFSHITSTSWLNNTRTYGDQKRRMGFINFEPISEELRAQHFANEERTVIKCILPREVLLERYYQEPEL